MSKLIVLDPGHGGGDPGSIQYDGEHEATFNLTLALAVRDHLLAGYDCQVAMTRKTNTAVVPGGATWQELEARGEMPNRLGADFLLSLHHNAASAAAVGAEMYIWTSLRTVGGRILRGSPKAGEVVRLVADQRQPDGTVNHESPNSLRLMRIAQPIIRDTLASLGIPWRGTPDRIMCADFAVIRGPKLPCALLETHFGTNAHEDEIMDNPAHIQTLAAGIARAVAVAMDLPAKAPAVSHVETPAAPPAQTIAFRDVPSDAWYAQDVADLKKMGVVNGDPGGTFRPGDVATRAEVAKMIRLAIRHVTGK